MRADTKGLRERAPDANGNQEEKAMTVKDIITKWLQEHGYDGLCTKDCGCRLDDLMPCSEGGDQSACVPGYNQPNPEGEWDFLIAPEKPEQKP